MQLYFYCEECFDSHRRSVYNGQQRRTMTMSGVALELRQPASVSGTRDLIYVDWTFFPLSCSFTLGTSFPRVDDSNTPASDGVDCIIVWVH